MVKKRFYLPMLILVLSIVFVLTACNNEDSEATPTPTATKEVERTPTPTPPPTATPAPTPKPLPDEQKGLLQEDAEEILKEEFEDDKFIEEGVTKGATTAYAIVDGQLKLSHDGSDFVDDWESYAFDYYAEVGKIHNQ